MIARSGRSVMSAPVPQGAGDESVERGNVEEEAVMAEGRRQFDEAGRGADALQRLDDAPRLGGRIEPVGIEADQSEAPILRPREGPRSAERRVGKECVCTGRVRWTQYIKKKKHKTNRRSRQGNNQQ